METNVVPLPVKLKATCSASVRDTDEATILSLPGRTRWTFTPEMRNSLVAFALSMPGMLPIVFDVDKAGSEVCRMADHVVIGWDCRHGLFLRDMRSGFVDHGPFKSVDEICGLIAYIGA